MTTTFDFSPLYRNAIGFDHFAQITEQLLARNALSARRHNTKPRVATCGSKSAAAMAEPVTKAATQPLKQARDSRYPHYNIVQIGELDFQITLALAGFSLDEIDITVTASEMIVTGKKTTDTAATQQFLHQGINQADFSRKFVLADHVQVQSASMEQGLLCINLTRELPEVLQPRKVAIGQTCK